MAYTTRHAAAQTNRVSACSVCGSSSGHTPSEATGDFSDTLSAKMPNSSRSHRSVGRSSKLTRPRPRSTLPPSKVLKLSMSHADTGAQSRRKRTARTKEELHTPSKRRDCSWLKASVFKTGHARVKFFSSIHRSELDRKSGTSDSSRPGSFNRQYTTRSSTTSVSSWLATKFTAKSPVFVLMVRETPYFWQIQWCSDLHRRPPCFLPRVMAKAS
mmetsp:Transcript_74544/g.174919  ORF Transcript_74544/g.174919 Transcript_74544/m.174919 type:complete len:214 (+) Transcript_74544:100-741(+)